MRRLPPDATTTAAARPARPRRAAGAGLAPAPVPVQAPPRWRAACVAAFLATWLATACSAPRPPEESARALAAPEAPSWPKPPDPPRIRFVRSVAGAADWGVRKSFFRRVIDVLAGRGEEHFVRPTGVAVQGRVLYVADPGAHAVWILDAERGQQVKVTQAGERTLMSPVAVAARADGAVYVADSVLKQVFLLGRDGALLGIAAQEGLLQPVGVEFDALGRRLFVADAAANRVVAFDADGRLVGSRGDPGEELGQFNHPTHLSLDLSGNLLVTDALNFRVQAIDRDGRFLWKLGHHGDGSGDLAAPKGVASDVAGHVYVVDALFDVVQIFTWDGTFLLAFGGHGEGPGQLWLPNGLCTDNADRIYVADAYNRRIQVYMSLVDASQEPRR